MIHYYLLDDYDTLINMSYPNLTKLSCVKYKTVCLNFYPSLCRLSDCGVTANGISFLSTALKTNPSFLRELDMSGNSLGDLGVNLLSAVLENLHCNLETLQYVLWPSYYKVYVILTKEILTHSNQIVFPSAWRTAISLRDVVVPWPQLSAQSAVVWESWTWVATSWRIQGWNCSVLDWGVLTVKWRHSGKLHRNTINIYPQTMANWLIPILWYHPLESHKLAPQQKQYIRMTTLWKVMLCWYIQSGYSVTFNHTDFWAGFGVGQGWGQFQSIREVHWEKLE